MADRQASTKSVKIWTSIRRFLSGSKKFLEKIEIAFKIFSYAVVGVASVVIAYQSYRINVQNMEMNDVARLPVISATTRITPENSPENNKYELLFENKGGVIYDRPEISAYSYVYIHSETKERIIPTNFYFQPVEASGDAEMIGGVLGNYANELQQLESLTLKKNIYFALNTVARVNYKDYMQRDRVDYFAVDSGLFAYRISESSFFKRKAMYDENSKNFKIFDSISESDIN